MAILTVDQFRSLVSSSLEDSALQILLDAAEQAIVAYAGHPTAATELLGGGSPYLTLSRPAASVTSIVETDLLDDSTTLAADDYEVYPGGYIIKRLRTGTNPRSSWRNVEVAYTPVPDTAERQRVQKELVELGINYSPGQTSEQIGAWMEQNQSSQDWNYASERDAILQSLNAASRPRMLVV